MLALVLPAKEALFPDIGEAALRRFLALLVEVEKFGVFGDVLLIAEDFASRIGLQWWRDLQEAAEVVEVRLVSRRFLGRYLGPFGFELCGSHVVAHRSKRGERLATIPPNGD